MQFFLLDFALAFVALLGYRALAAVARRPAVLLGRSHPQPARADIARPGRRVEPEAVPAERALPDGPSCCEDRTGR